MINDEQSAPRGALSGKAPTELAGELVDAVGVFDAYAAVKPLVQSIKIDAGLQEDLLAERDPLLADLVPDDVLQPHLEGRVPDLRPAPLHKVAPVHPHAPRGVGREHLLEGDLAGLDALEGDVPAPQREVAGDGILLLRRSHVIEHDSPEGTRPDKTRQDKKRQDKTSRPDRKNRLEMRKRS